MKKEDNLSEGQKAFDNIKYNTTCMEACDLVHYMEESDIKAVDKDLLALRTLKELLFLEVREIGGRYYIKYMNLEEGNYIDEEISKELYEVLV